MNAQEKDLVLAAATQSAFEQRLLGRNVLPIGPDKRPFNGLAWKRYQTEFASDEQFMEWLRMEPPAWAIVTGRVSRVVVLDFDGIDGRALLTMFRLEPHVLTPSGGAHVYVAHPGWKVPTLNCKSSKKLAASFPGLDIRGDGGYAGFAGSVAHGTYRIARPLDAEPLNAIPSGIRRATGMLVKPKHVVRKHAAKSPAELTQKLAEILIERAATMAPSHGRNNACFWLAIQARDNGFLSTDTWILDSYRARLGDRNVKGELEAFLEREAIHAWRNAFAESPRAPWGRR